MKRTPLKRKTPMRQRRAAGPDTKREPRPMTLLPTIRPRKDVTYGGSTSGVPVDKAPHGHMQAIRDSAKGEACTVRIEGCPSDPTKTIWSHYRGSAGGKAMGIKSFDLAGAYACTYCDAVYDGQQQRPAGWSKEDVDLAWHDGHIRSLVRLAQKGLLK